MRLIPPILLNENSGAEARLFELLRTVDSDDYSTALHSLNLPWHQYKLTGELDFVLIGPNGLLVLEVKGGGVRLQDGIWYFRDRYGNEHRKSEGPFRQAQSGMYALREQLCQAVGKLRIDGIRIGYGVVFPDIEFHEVSIEWPQESILDSRYCGTATNVGRYLTRLGRYWRAKEPRHPKLAAADVQSILRLLRPEFEIVPSLMSQVEEIDRVLTRLTDDQMSALDGLEENARFICEGGAGTGKTFLAAEVARRLAHGGMKVLFTCLSPTLCSHIQARLPEQAIDVVPFEELSHRTTQYDALIVDEGQDLLTLESLVLLDDLLVGGLERGTWRVFLDRNTQAGLCGQFEEAALEFLHSLHPAKYVLRRNCRNTNEIVSQTQLFTGADMGAPTAGAGVPVIVRFYDSDEEAVSCLQGHLKRLAGKGARPGDITLLSGQSSDGSLVDRLPSDLRRGIVPVTPEVAGSFPPNAITFATAQNFKGLENRFVVLIDVGAVASVGRDRALLYTAMSRARAELIILLPESLRADVDKLQLDNLHKIYPNRATP